MLNLFCCILFVLAASATYAMRSGSADGAWPKPPFTDKVGTARWMMASIDWAVLATKSVHLGGVPFGNIISSANVTTKEFGGGVPVFYTSPMDTSMQDIAINNSVSLTYSEAELRSECSPASGGNSSQPDPELPTCARLTFSGKFVKTPAHEVARAKEQLFRIHPQMKEWPGDHDWEVCQLDIQEIWMIDFFGGATHIPPAQYAAYQPPSREV